MPRRPRDWVPDQDLTISRLAWLAAFPELHRRALPWWRVPFQAAGPVRLTHVSGSRYAPWAGAWPMTSDRMASYADPVDTAAARLSTDEQTALRDSGTLPDWFFDAVEKERKAERRSQR